jgi:hypothetical protein
MRCDAVLANIVIVFWLKTVNRYARGKSNRAPAVRGEAIKEGGSK